MKTDQIQNTGKIYYVLPSVSISGGVAVVLQHTNRLKLRGYDVSIIVLSGNTKPLDWFENSVPILSSVKISKKKLANSTMIATHWSTVDYVKNMGQRRIYFVQSDERRFVLSTEELKLCTETYRSNNFEFMTEAKWIQRWLKQEFKQTAYYVPNGLDTELFNQVEAQKPRKKIRVLIEGPIDCHFKGVEAAYKSVEKLDVEIWLVSSSGYPPKDWRINRFFRSIKMNKMKEIYSACDILVKLSRVEGFFGPPLEAMACGCTVVVGVCTGYDEYIEHNKNALVVPKSDIHEATEAVKRLQLDSKLRKKLQKNGFETAKKWSWENSIQKLEEVLGQKNVKVAYSKSTPDIYDFRSEISELQYQIMLVRNATQPYRLEVNGLHQQIQSLKHEINSIYGGKVISRYLSGKSTVKKTTNKIKSYRKNNTVKNNEKLIIVIGRGHSGTRLISDCLEKSGVYMGDTNNSGDHIPPDALYRASYIAGNKIKQIGKYEWDFDGLARTFPPEEYITNIREYSSKILRNIGKSPSGWKLPETILSYPWIVQLFPEAYYIHWTRDPRDALLGQHITDYLGYWNIPSSYTEESSKSKIESWIYQRRIVEQTPLPQNFIHINFENFVNNQAKELKKLSVFLGIKLKTIEVNKNKVQGINSIKFPESELIKYGYQR